MDKLKLAHDWAMRNYGQFSSMAELANFAWQYADAMQAEAEKREDKTRPEALCEVDWSQAPDDATHYVIFADGLAYWYKSEKLECFDIAPSFGIFGMCVVERSNGF